MRHTPPRLRRQRRHTEGFHDSSRSHHVPRRHSDRVRRMQPAGPIRRFWIEPGSHRGDRRGICRRSPQRIEHRTQRLSPPGRDPVLLRPRARHVGDRGLAWRTLVHGDPRAGARGERPLHRRVLRRLTTGPAGLRRAGASGTDRALRERARRVRRPRPRQAGP